MAGFRTNPKARRAAWKGVPVGLLFFFTFCHYMLPLERGFDYIDLGDHPLPIAVVISMFVFGTMLLLSNGKVLRYCYDDFGRWQCLLSFIIVLSALHSDIPLASFSLAVRYFTIWVLNYASIRYIMESKSRETLVHMICFMAGLAAMVGIMEGLFSVRLPIYQHWVESYYGAHANLANIQDFKRCTGTLGHPHIFSTALLLTLPFVWQLRPRLLQIPLCGMILIASLLTVSRSVIVFLCVLSLGYFIVSKSKVFLAVGVVFLSVVMLTTLSDTDLVKSSPQLLLWAQRLNLVEGTEGTNASQSESGRLGMWTTAMSEFVGEGVVSQLFGGGMMSSVDVAEEGTNNNTLDNTYITILYEQGIFGLLLFCFIFGALLWKLRRFATSSLHVCSIFGLLMVGQTFVLIYYSTFNFVALASIAYLMHFYEHPEEDISPNAVRAEGRKRKAERKLGGGGRMGPSGPMWPVSR